MEYAPVKNHITADETLLLLNAESLFTCTAPGTFVRLKATGKVKRTRTEWSIPVATWNGARMPRITDATIWTYYTSNPGYAQ